MDIFLKESRTGEMKMTTVNRISAVDAKKTVNSDLGLLVCIYDDEKYNAGANLNGSIPMSEFLKMKPDIPTDTTIIFY